MTARLLVIGASGQLGTALMRLAPPPGFVLQGLDRSQLDLAQTAEIAATVRALRPDAVINAAAYTAVDQAEDQQAEAFVLNRDAPAALGQVCADLGAPLVHLSTDYVFDGAKADAYVETDTRAPLNVYGRSKAEGEDAVLASGAPGAVIRTSWVYGAHGANFLRTMLRLAKARDEVNVVADQIGRPTWASDLARCCLDVAARAMEARGAAAGVFHYAGAGDTNWADFAEAIFAERNIRTRVNRITTAEYPAQARRPANSRLDCGNIRYAWGIEARPWRDALKLCLADI